MANSLGNLPDFVDCVDDRYKCAQCRETLQPPVKQLSCGHRICDSCEAHLPRAALGVRCPSGEEDCAFEAITVYLDPATSKEMLRKKVHCSNRDKGCDSVFDWGSQIKHDNECQFTEVKCQNAGCEQTIFRSDRERHTRECNYAPVACEYCGTSIPQILMDQGHAEQCAAKERECVFASHGCTFKGTYVKYQEHLQTKLANHLNILLEETKKLKTHQTNSVGKLQDSFKDIKAKMTESEKIIVNNFLDQIITIAGDNFIGIKINADATLVKKVDDAIAKVDALAQTQSQNCERRNETINALQTCNAKLMDEIKAMKTYMVHFQHDDLQNENYQHHNGEDIIEKVNPIQRTADLRFRLLETVAFDGRLIWRIPNYSRRKQDALEGRTLSLYSKPFYSSHYGYKMCARVYLNGDGLGKGSHLSLFFVLMRGEYDPLLSWPFRQRVTLSLLDQSGGRRHMTDTFRPDPDSSSFRKPAGEMNIASGSPLFAPHAKVESEPYLKDDTLFVCITIDKTDLPDPLM